MARSIVQNARVGERGRLGGIAGLAARGALALAIAVLPAACAPRPASAVQESAQGGGPGGPFTLVDQDGRTVDQSVLNGKWSLVFFGYTFCPNFCPLTLTTLGKTMQALGPRAAHVQVVFITIDPQRDTPAQLKTYLSSKVFPRNIIGLTGTPAEVAQAAKDYVVYYHKNGTGPDYLMDHSTAIYLMDPKGRYQGVLSEDSTPQQQADQISRAMSGET